MIRALIEALGSGKRSTAITPHDSNVIVSPMRELHCGGNAGTVVGFLRDDDTSGTARTFNVASGGSLPFDFQLIKTGSTATGLVAIG